MIIVGGTASGSLAREIAAISGGKLAEVESKRFPDGEFYCRIHTDLGGQDVVLVQTTYPDEKLVELFILQDAARDFEVRSLTTVVPYFGYARQDKKFLDGEAISARKLAKLIQMQSDAFVTVDIHAPKILEWFDIPAHDVSVMPAVGRFLKDYGVELVLAPDKGALARAEATASVLCCEWDHLEKTRIDGETVKMAPKNLKVDGKVVAIVDDIIATGGTIITATKTLREQGASKVYAACAHGLYTKNALDRLGPACDEVFSADTIENPTSKISAAAAIAAALKN
jgi:ribose-phosphate pyrophosphokinase